MQRVRDARPVALVGDLDAAAAAAIAALAAFRGPASATTPCTRILALDEAAPDKRPEQRLALRGGGRGRAGLLCRRANNHVATASTGTYGERKPWRLTSTALVAPEPGIADGHAPRTRTTRRKSNCWPGRLRICHDLAAVPGENVLRMRAKRRNGASVALALALAVVWAVACSSTGGGSSTAEDAGTEAATWGASDCSSCIDSRCAQQIQTCSEEPSCAAHLTCLRKCPVAADGDVDSKCAAQCPAGSGTSGKAAVAALDQCRESGAGASCTACGATNNDGGGDSGCDMPLLCQQCGPSQQADANSCTACEEQHCCDSHHACENDPACLAYFTCINSGCTPRGSADCIGSCDKAHPGGFQKFAEVVACLQVKCDNGECVPASKCRTCLADNCGKLEAACMTNKACDQALDCTGGCSGSSQCIDACKTSYPGSEPMLDAFDSCMVTMCQGCQ